MNKRRSLAIGILGLGVYVGVTILPRDSMACGGEWYPALQVDPRIHGVARAEESLAKGRHVAAASAVIRMMPHIKTLRSKPGSLVGRSERVLAVALARTDGRLAARDELPSELAKEWAGADETSRVRNLAWAVEVLRRQANAPDAQPSLQSDLGEALSKLEPHRVEARGLLEKLAERDLVATPEAYRALAFLRARGGDHGGEKVALQRCEAMAKDKSACSVAS